MGGARPPPAKVLETVGILPARDWGAQIFQSASMGAGPGQEAEPVAGDGAFAC